MLSKITPSQQGANRWLLALAVALFLLMPAAVLADEPPAGAETCAECHTEETEAWQNSTHALTEDGAGAACESCHGTYVEGHPDAGVMQLNVDSAICETCHGETFTQWQGSIHAEAGVQCIGCHVSHTQDLRLNDETLCESCHRDRGLTHGAHTNSDVDCIACHIGTKTDHDVSTNTDVIECMQQEETMSHDFAGVTAKNCMTCHDGDTIHSETIAGGAPSSMLVSDSPDVVETPCTTLKSDLKEAEKNSSSLQILAVAGLGVGLGIGAMLGVVAMLFIGYISKGSKENA